VAEKPHPAREFSILVFLSRPDAPGYAARRTCQPHACLTRPAFVNRACDVCFRAMGNPAIAPARTGVAAPFANE
jgi:hypothetical protein